MSNCNIIITLSTDEYKAYADFIPVRGEGAELSLTYAKTVINESGIIHGVDWDIVSSTIDFCASQKKDRLGVKIATGTLAVSEVSKHWDLEDKFFRNAMGFDTEALKVDHKEHSDFIMVKKGELLAHLNSGRDGIQGKSVKGKPIPFKKKKIVQFTNGRNTTEHEGRLYASTSGRYEVSEDRDIHINDVLHIEGNVNYSTGNISFGKDVIIDGEIKDGFKVAAGGSLYCKSNLDASDVLCRKDLIIDQGIIGRGTALVRVGGKVKGKFIENCHVESKSGIDIEKNIMNSEVFSLGHVLLGEKGSIVSSKISAELGVKTYNVGKEGSPNSEINLGFSFIEQRAIASIILRTDVLKTKLTALNKLPEYRKTDKKMDLIRQIQDAVTRCEAELSEKKSNLDKSPDVTLQVFGTIYPGNCLSICGVKYSVTEAKKKVKFYLNRESNRIETVNL